MIKSNAYPRSTIGSELICQRAPFCLSKLFKLPYTQRANYIAHDHAEEDGLCRHVKSQIPNIPGGRWAALSGNKPQITFNFIKIFDLKIDKNLNLVASSSDSR